MPNIISISDLQKARKRTIRISEEFSFRDANASEKTLQRLSKARKLQNRINFGGLNVSIENRKGSIRHWYDKATNTSGTTKMLYPYGYVRGSIGSDGDHVDVFIGPNENATHAFVIDQMRSPDFKTFDEQKVMLGFDDADQAKKAYLKHFDNPKFFGKMKAMPFAEFARKVLSTSEKKPLVKGLGDGPIKGETRSYMIIDDFVKAEQAQIYYGPRGGKYLDPEHKIPYKERKGRAKAKAEPAKKRKAKKKEEPTVDPGWKQTADGWTGFEGRVKLSREGKQYSITIDDKNTYPLGRRATFTDAEKVFQSYEKARGKALRAERRKLKAQLKTPTIEEREKRVQELEAQLKEAQKKYRAARKKREKLQADLSAKVELTPDKPQTLQQTAEAAVATYGKEHVRESVERTAKSVARKADDNLRERAAKLAQDKRVQELVRKAEELKEEIKTPSLKQLVEAATKRREATAERLRNDPKIYQQVEQQALEVTHDTIIDMTHEAVLLDKTSKPEMAKAIALATVSAAAGSFLAGFINYLFLYMAGADRNLVSETVRNNVGEKLNSVLDKVGLSKEATEGTLSEEAEKKIKSVASIAGALAGGVAGLVPMMFGVGLAKSEPHLFIKAGPYIGPKGGKWADPQHTIPWKEGASRTGVIKLDAVKLRGIVDKLFEQAYGEPNEHGFRGIPAGKPQRANIDKNVVVEFKSKADVRGFARGETRQENGKTVVRLFVHEYVHTDDVDKVKRHYRETAAHELSHAYDPSLTRGKLGEAIRRAVGAETPEEAHRALGLPERAPEKRMLKEYRNLKYEVTATLQQVHRDLIDKKAADFLREKDIELEGGLTGSELVEWAGMFSETFKDVMKDYTEQNKKRMMRMIADTATALREEKIKPIEKSERFTIAADLFKAITRPPGGGWQLIPAGRRGGFRRKRGKRYEYWYPEGKGPVRGAPWTERPKFEPMEYNEDQFRLGEFNKDPSMWQFVRLPGQATIVGWTQGGVNPDSKHPVKIAGVEHKLYQIIEREAEPGWARLRNVNDPNDMPLVKQERVYPVNYGPKPKVVVKPDLPKWEPERPPTGKKSGPVIGSEKKTPAFADSKAKKGTALFNVEKGKYPIRSVRYFAEDADGVPRQRERFAMAMPDAEKVKLIKEFAPMIKATARRTIKSFGIKQTSETQADLQSAAMEGFLNAIDQYPGGVSFASHAKFLSDQYARLHAAREFAGGVALPKRHARLIRGFIAARAEAARIYETDKPTAEQVAQAWKVHKRDIHEGLITGKNQPLPMGRYDLVAGEIKERGKEQPGKVEWAEQLGAFLDGQMKAEGSEFFDTGMGLYEGPGVSGVGMSEHDKILIRHDLSGVLDKMRDFKWTEGYRTYKANAADVITKMIGLEGDPQSAAAIATDLRVEFLSGDDWRPLSERHARRMVPIIFERAMRELRAAQLLPETKGVIERTASRMLPEPIVPRGHTWRALLQGRAKAITREQVRAWRDRQRDILKRAEQVAIRDGDEGRAAGMRKERERLKGIGLKRARILAAEYQIRTRPHSAEWFRNAEGVIVERPASGSAHLGIIVLRTDPATGRQQRVRVQSLDDLRMHEETYKSEAIFGPTPDIETLQLVAHFPMLAQLVFASNDVAALAPTLDREIVLELMGLIDG